MLEQAEVRGVWRLLLGGKLHPGFSPWYLGHRLFLLGWMNLDLADEVPS